MSSPSWLASALLVLWGLFFFVPASAAQPVFSGLSPADGALLTSGQGTLAGTASGADSLTIDGTSVALGAGGAFSYAFDLEEGPQTVQLVADGPGGQTAILHALTVDTLAPALVLTSPTSTVVSGTPLLVSGTVSEPHLASITVGGVPALENAGAWSAEIAGLTEGSQTLEVRAADTLGNASVLQVPVFLDSAPPQITVLEAGQPFSGGLFARPVTPVISVSDATDLTTEIRLDGALYASGTEIAAEGAHSLSVTATDAAGWNQQMTVDFTLDLTPPSLGALLPANGAVLGSSEATLQVNAPGATRVQVGSASAVGTSPFTLQVPLAEGRNDLLVEAFDDAGNRVQRAHRLDRDTTPPQLEIATPRSGDTVSTSLIEVAGSASDERLLEVLVNGQPANLVGTTFEALDVPLVAGSNVVSVVASDSVGNSASAQVTITLDQSAPTFSVTANGQPLVSGDTFAQDVTLDVLLDDPASTLEATLDGAPFTPPQTLSADGQHELSVTVRDAANLASSALYVFTVDRGRPVFAAVAPESGHVQSAAEVVLTGTARGAVQLTVDGQPANLFATTPGAADFSAGPFTLTEGERTLTLVATGANGLETTLGHPVIRDLTAPALQINSPGEDTLTSSAAVTVSGTLTEPHPLRVSVSGVEATLSGSTFLARDVALSEGANTLTVVAEDRAGNRSESVRRITLDSESPSLAVTDPSGGTQTPDASYLVRGTAQDAHLDRVEVSGFRASVDSEGAWSVSVPLESGANDLVATAIDAVGQRTEVSFTVFRDTEAPAVQIAVPEQNTAVSAAEIEVRGSADDEAGVTVKVNGIAAFLDRGTWSATVPLAPGENVLTARATDAQGNEGVHTRTVVRDQDSPRYSGVEPAAGALALPISTSFRLNFSEEMRAPAAGAITLRSGAQDLAFGAEVDGLGVVVTPAGPLPSGQRVEMTLSSALVDRAGNALLEVPGTLSWTTADAGAPPAPVLAPEPPSHLCAPSIRLTGTTAGSVVVEVTGGAGVARERSDESGAFTLVADLRPASLNRLELVALDADGDRSSPTVAEVVQDCRGPVVEEAELNGLTLTVTFSEEVDGATLQSAVTLQDASGPLTLTSSLLGASASFTLDRAASGPAALEVTPAVQDLAGNALAFSYAQVFGQAAGDSFFSGTVLDAATGRPLAGAVAQVTATGGAPLADPIPQQTTGEDGRVLITLPAGTHDVIFARDGYVPVLRAITTQTGEGTQFFDPRLQPAAQAASVPAGGGTAGDEEGGASLEIPSGGLGSATAVAVTALDEQSLPALLPYGWSPRGGAFVDIAGDLLQPAILRFPVTAPNGTVLPVARLDLQTLQWAVVHEAAASGGEVVLGVSSMPAGVGAWVAVEADTGATAPPAASIGQVLGSSPAPSGGEVASASIAFNPTTVLPTQRSRARVTYGLNADAPSGVPLTLWIEERLTLLGGGERVSAPFPADLILYRDSAGQPESSFWLEPSEAARQQPVDVGSEVVTVRPYGDETVRGDVLGPEGGSVQNAEGDRVDLPAGALAQPAAVVVERLGVADLPLAAPRGAAVEGVVKIDLGPNALLAPADFTLALDPAPSGEGLLLEVVQISGAWSYRPVAALEPDPAGWRTRAIDPADLPWPGLRESGLYAAVRLTVDHAYVRGQVVDSSAQPASGVVIESPSVDWLQLSGIDGRYVLPLPEDGANHDVSFTDPDSGDGITVSVPTTGDRVDLDPALLAVGPYVLEILPGDGSLDVPLGQEPTVRFSEPVVRSSLEGEVRLLLDGVPVEVDLDHQGDLVRLVPRATLLADAEYEIEVRSGVRDLAGHALVGALVTSFRTQEDPTDFSGRLDPSKVRLLAPGPDGNATIVGLAGAVPGEALLYVENQVSFTQTVTIQAEQDGSFTLTVPASVSDRLVLHVLREGSSEDLMVLGPFLSSDGRQALVGPEGARFLSADGFELIIEEGTFDVGTWVRIEPRAVADGPLASAPEFQALQDFAVEFSGDARRPMRVRVPSAAPLSAGADYQLHRYVEVLGQRGYMLH
ncbi:MAG: Ig-like domain-containing protein, partial [Acidobacteriota bacterium]